MMKQSTKRFLVISAMVMAIGLFYWGIRYEFHLPEIRGRTLLRYIPSEISKRKALIGVVGINNFEDIYKRLRSTNFLKSFINSELYTYLSEISGHDQKLKTLRHNLNAGISFKEVMDIIGRKFIVAVYKSDSDTPDYILVSSIKDVTGIKEVFYRALENKELAVSEYLNVNINVYSEKYFYTVLEGTFILGSSLDLIKRVIDIKKNQSKLSNFNTVFPWVEEKIDASYDGYIFSANKELSNMAGNLIPKSNFYISRVGEPAVSFTLQKFKFDKGLFVKSFGKLKKKKPLPRIKEALSASKSIGIIPDRPLLAGGSNSFNTDSSLGESISGTILNYFKQRNIDLNEEILNNLGSEVSFAILGPSPESINMALPGLLIYFEIKNKEKQQEIYEKLEKIFNIDATEEEYSNIKYKKVEFPVFFGQKIQVCAVPITIKGKYFIALITSEKIIEYVINLTRGRGKSLVRSPAWKEITNYLPREYLSFSYADINGLTRTVGLFVANLRGNSKLESFFEIDPFSWIGPSGSVTTYSQNLLIVQTYFPMQDLSSDKWKEIFKSLYSLISQ